MTSPLSDPHDGRAREPDEAPHGAAAAAVLPAAVLWDMDGTLINSEPYWMAAEGELVARHGGTWSHEDGLSVVGTPLETAAQILIDHGVRLSVPEVLEFLIARVEAALVAAVPWQPGARELLERLTDAGVPNALVTMSYRSLAAPVVGGVPAGVFGAVVCGEDVTNGKPDPEAYLVAAERLGVDIRRCVAIEDSVPGIASAYAAGARTIGVQVMVPIEPRPGLSRVAALADVSVDDLCRVAGGETIDRLTAVTAPV